MAQKKATRQAILEAVVTCIEKYGIDKVTTRKIAVEAGTNIASINYYFRSKDELIEETLSMTIRHMMEDVIAAIDDAGKPFDAALTELVSYLIDGGRRFPGISKAHLYRAVVQGDKQSISAQVFTKVFDHLAQRAVREYPSKSPKELRFALSQMLSSIMFFMLSPDFFPLSREYQFTNTRNTGTLTDSYTRQFKAML